MMSVNLLQFPSSLPSPRPPSVERDRLCNRCRQPKSRRGALVAVVAGKGGCPVSRFVCRACVLALRQIGGDL